MNNMIMMKDIVMIILIVMLLMIVAASDEAFTIDAHHDNVCENDHKEYSEDDGDHD